MNRNLKLSGAWIYIIGVILLVLKHNMFHHSYADFYDLFGLAFINPLMIYIYDYLIDFKVLRSKKYQIMIGLCYLLELFGWNYFRQMQASGAFIDSFVGKVISVALIIQFIFALISIRHCLRAWKAMLLLILMPAMTYFILALMSSLVGFASP